VKLRATLFDMDGLLLDSETLWHQAELEIFGALGVPLASDKDRSTKGMFVDEVVRYWYTQHPWSGPTAAEVSAQLLERVGELVETQGELLPGALRALDLTSTRGPLALASSTPMPLIMRCLTHFGLVDRFAAIRSADVEPYGKPHPGVFLEAARALDVAPAACLVFEDSAAGVLAGKAGRMTVIAVPTLLDRILPEFAIADLVLDSLEQLTDEWLDARFA
jgi:HAD superfamily hydrolase (TIGR01509 family)